MHKKLKLEILEKMTTLIAAGLGLVAALAWNEAIKKLFEAVFGKASNLLAMFLYAILITIIVVVLTINLSRTTNKLKQELGLDKAKEDKNK
ncbi:MAG: DUF5654 family protein [Patescibacteria group bacterium]